MCRWTEGLCKGAPRKHLWPKSFSKVPRCAPLRLCKELHFVCHVLKPCQRVRIEREGCRICFSRATFTLLYTAQLGTHHGTHSDIDR